jgi:hypothetical protein
MATSFSGIKHQKSINQSNIAECGVKNNKTKQTNLEKTI